MSQLPCEFCLRLSTCYDMSLFTPPNSEVDLGALEGRQPYSALDKLYKLIQIILFIVLTYLPWISKEWKEITNHYYNKETEME